MMIHPCAKYGKLMSIKKKVMGRTRKHVKNPTNLTLRSKFNVVSGSGTSFAGGITMYHDFLGGDDRRKKITTFRNLF